MAAPMQAHTLVNTNRRFWRFSVAAVSLVRNYASVKPNIPVSAEDSSSGEVKKFYAEDGIIKRSGVLISNKLSFDGKPIYPGKHKKVKVDAGTLVRAGMILVQQKRLNFHPGLHVGLGRDLTLYAYEDGIVCITSEKVAFDWSRNLVRRFYFDQRGVTTYKLYYHVIPKPQHNRFKLISQT